MTNETLNAETILESMDMGMSTILTEAARITHKYSTSSMALGHFLSALLDTSDTFKAMLMDLGVSEDSMATAKSLLHVIWSIENEKAKKAMLCTLTLCCGAFSRPCTRKLSATV